MSETATDFKSNLLFVSRNWLISFKLSMMLNKMRFRSQLKNDNNEIHVCFDVCQKESSCAIDFASKCITNTFGWQQRTEFDS